MLRGRHQRAGSCLLPRNGAHLSPRAHVAKMKYSRHSIPHATELISPPPRHIRSRAISRAPVAKGRSGRPRQPPTRFASTHASVHRTASSAVTPGPPEDQPCKVDRSWGGVLGTLTDGVLMETPRHQLISFQIADPISTVTSFSFLARKANRVESPDFSSDDPGDACGWEWPRNSPHGCSSRH